MEDWKTKEGWCHNMAAGERENWYDHGDTSFWEGIYEEVEQHTKEACLEAGWDWIQSNINAQLPMLNRELSFKQAIDSAKTE